MHNVSYNYPRGTKALDNVSITIPSNEVFGLLGSNGSGKTTMMNCLAGIIKPDRGAAIANYGSKRVDLFTTSKISHLFSVVPQLDIYWPNLTIREHLQVFEKINVKKLNYESLLNTTKL